MLIIIVPQNPTENILLRTLSETGVFPNYSEARKFLDRLLWILIAFFFNYYFFYRFVLKIIFKIFNKIYYRKSNKSIFYKIFISNSLDFLTRQRITPQRMKLEIIFEVRSKLNLKEVHYTSCLL